MNKKCVLALGLLSVSMAALASENSQSIDLTDYQLDWSDEFNYPDKQLDEMWISQNGPTENEWVLSSRWRDNAVVRDGVLYLESRKESRGGQDWTTGNIWSKRTFGYGYYEAKMKYAGAYGTNNSFWLWPKQGVAEGDKACEIDINEGHYPNIINTNIHNWTDKYTLPDGRVSHSDNQLHHTLHGSSDHNVVVDPQINATKIRLRSNNPASIHISEFKVLNAKGENIVSEANIATNGTFTKLPSKDIFAIDEREDTRWVSEKHGEKWLELTWKKPQQVTAIELINGWLQEVGASEGRYRNLISDYVIEYFDGSDWLSVAQYDAATVADYSEQWHTYGLEWDEGYFRFYLDGELYHEMRNEVCFSETTMLFSLAILKADISGPVTDAIDGTSMKVDWVRYYTKK
ncbi:glycoside hydrolase family 16 protein [Gilvimarinus polysaccharolyticus]|uniref:glycoside hydrolase family 16 protein n=1 Tax=Gilvimarinus polysaccharolyticus TaxID=863921 RepID=UPI0006733CCD|nr:family 16 glycosylhydrolase [Gilvimarinus polysaccharolyticus]